MNYILVDIKKFLKKLETGQLEIEAGQWELHKDIINLKNSIQELKQLKKDLHLVKDHGMKQTNLIKELQLKFNKLEKMKSSDHWFNTSCSSHTFENNLSGSEKVRKKAKNRPNLVLRSGKVSGCKNSVKKRKSVKGFNGRNEKEGALNKCTKQKCQGNSCQSYKKLRHQNGSKKPPEIPTSDNDILQRYLEDSARYRKTSNRSCALSEKSSQDETVETTERDSPNNFDSLQANFDMREQTKAESDGSTFHEKFDFIKHPEKSSFKNICLKHNRRYQKTKPFFTYNVCKKCFLGKNSWKRHGKGYQNISKSFRGFRCSYCDKICQSPEKLTAHLKSCRIIKKCKPVKNK